MRGGGRWGNICETKEKEGRKERVRFRSLLDVLVRLLLLAQQARKSFERRTHEEYQGQGFEAEIVERGEKKVVVMGRKAGGLESFHPDWERPDQRESGKFLSLPNVRHTPFPLPHPDDSTSFEERRQTTAASKGLDRERQA